MPVTGELRVEDGFVVGIHADLETLAESRVFSLAPIRALGVTVTEPEKAADQLLALSRLEQLRELTLLGVGSLPGLARILGSPRLAGIRRLTLRLLDLGPDEGAALAATHVQHLVLHDCRLAMQGALGGRSFERLEIVGAPNAGDEELRAMISRPLRELALQGAGHLPFLDGAIPERLELVGYTVHPASTSRVAALTSTPHVEFRGASFTVPAALYGMVHALPPSVATLVLRGGYVGRKPVGHYANEIRARTRAEVILC